MKKIVTILMFALMIFVLTACGAEENKSSGEPATETAAANENSEAQSSKKILVAYFSCTNTTKTLAEAAAEVLDADLYEIKPAEPYTADDLNWRDETTRATVEQRDEKFRVALADNNAPVAQYDTIVIAFPIWWGIAPRIIDTFVETYDFTGKTIVPICTSGGSDIATSAEFLQTICNGQATWKQGKCFYNTADKDELKNYFNSLGL